MALPNYYQNFCSQWGVRPHRTAILPVKEAKTYAQLFRTFKGLRHQPKGKDRIRAVVTARLGPAHQFGRCEPVLVGAVVEWMADSAHSVATQRGYLTVFAGWIRATGLRRIDHHRRVSPHFLAGWRDWYAETRSPRTVNTGLQVMRSWFTWLRDLGWIVQSPWRNELLVEVDKARLYHKNRAGHVRRYLSFDDGDAILSWADAQEPVKLVAICLLGLVGLRRNEASEAAWDGLHDRDDRPHLTIIGKGKRTRAIALEPRVVEAFDLLRSSGGRPPTTGPILRKDGKGISTWTLGRWVKLAGAAIDRPDLTPHELRRTFATWLRKSGAPATTGQRALGHAKLETTQQHYDLSEADEWRGGLKLGARRGGKA